MISNTGIPANDIEDLCRTFPHEVRVHIDSYRAQYPESAGLWSELFSDNLFGCKFFCY